jgi:hypothetical protein
MITNNRPKDKVVTIKEKLLYGNNQHKNCRANIQRNP